MNALSIYLSTSKYVMQANFTDRDSWSELYRYIPYLRQALSCCVCRNLLKIPMGPSHKVCQHFVCQACVEEPMTLKPQCSWCKKRAGFEESKQLRMVVSCFKKLCEYIMSSPIGSDLQGQAKNGETESLVRLIKEGVDFDDDFQSPCIVPLPIVGAMPSLVPPSDVTSEPTADVEDTNPVSQTQCVINNQPIVKLKKMKKVKKATRKKIRFKKYKWYTKPKKKIPLKDNNMKNTKLSTVEVDKKLVNILPSSQIKYEIKRESIDEDRPKLKVKLRAKKMENFSDTDFSSDSETIKGHNSDDTLRKDKYTSIEPSIKKLKLIFGENEIKICKCGRGGTSSQLTCLGQRCPCYVKKMPCLRCKCRGCRNPRKSYDSESDQTMRSFNTTSEHLFVSL